MEAYIIIASIISLLIGGGAGFALFVIRHQAEV